MPCIVALAPCFLCFCLGIATCSLNALLAEPNHLVGVTLLSHYYMRLGSVAWGLLGLVDSRQPKFFHLVFDALRDCHDSAVGKNSLATALTGGQPTIIATSLPGSVGGRVLSGKTSVCGMAQIIATLACDSPSPSLS